MSITNYLNKIKTAVYGRDVRGAIHDAIKECYDDASVNHDNANMEVKMARGTHNTLNDRLDKSDEIQAQTNAQLSQVSNLFKDKTWCSVGDSITADGGYQLACDKYVGFSKITNVGVSASTLSDSPSGVTNMWEVADNVEYHDLFTIAGATNDWYFDMPLGDVDDRNTKTVCGALNHILTTLIVKYPKAKIIVFTPIQRDMKIDTVKNNIGLTLYDYVVAIKRVCKKYGVAVLDLYNVSGINKFNMDYYLYDRLHPNKNGNDLIGSIIARFINSPITSDTDLSNDIFALDAYVCELKKMCGLFNTKKYSTERPFALTDVSEVMSTDLTSNLILNEHGYLAYNGEQTFPHVILKDSIKKIVFNIENLRFIAFTASTDKKASGVTFSVDMQDIAGKTTYFNSDGNTFTQNEKASKTLINDIAYGDKLSLEILNDGVEFKVYRNDEWKLICKKTIDNIDFGVYRIGFVPYQKMAIAKNIVVFEN